VGTNCFLLIQRSNIKKRFFSKKKGKKKKEEKNRKLLYVYAIALDLPKTTQNSSEQTITNPSMKV
jgi:hypothetical protein